MAPRNPIEPAEETAKQAHLRYITDASPGFSRTKLGKGFAYHDTAGKRLRDKAVVERINHLAIPPAWTNVWICSSDRGHLQATGRDDRGRKQYRYHDKWNEVRDATKYDRMLAFGYALPHIRRRVAKDMRAKGLPKQKVLATIVRLMDKAQIRVGNEEYARENKSYGLTTMHNRHARVRGKTITFEFTGKSGVDHEVVVEDGRLADIVKRCLDVPGYELFQYIDAAGERHSVHSDDVNAYLKEISGEEFTAKDFRTWHGTVLAVDALGRCEPCATKAALKRNLNAAIDEVAEHLGNTRAVCRKSYVHPGVLGAYLDESLGNAIAACRLRKVPRKLAKLPIHEAVVVMFLEKST